MTRQQFDVAEIVIAIISIIVAFVIIQFILSMLSLWSYESNVKHAKTNKFYAQNKSTFEVGCGRCNKKKKSHSRSRSHSNDPTCPDCKPGGLDYDCRVNTDCACGLTCEANRCVCAKPAPVAQVLVSVIGNQLTVTWPSAQGADYYNLFINGPSNATVLYTGQNSFTQTVADGIYTATVQSGNYECGSDVQAFTESEQAFVGDF